jgi:hypothetical protein
VLIVEKIDKNRDNINNTNMPRTSYLLVFVRWKERRQFGICEKTK